MLIFDPHLEINLLQMTSPFGSGWNYSSPCTLLGKNRLCVLETLGRKHGPTALFLTHFCLKDKPALFVYHVGELEWEEDYSRKLLFRLFQLGPIYRDLKKTIRKKYSFDIELTDMSSRPTQNIAEERQR